MDIARIPFYVSHFDFCIDVGSSAMTDVSEILFFQVSIVVEMVTMLFLNCGLFSGIASELIALAAAGAVTDEMDAQVSTVYYYLSQQ